MTEKNARIFSVRLTLAEFEILRKLSKKKGVSRNRVIRDAVRALGKKLS